MYAKILADSVSAQGHRLTTMEIQTWRFVLAEFNTHRRFSRNSASSRAIPVAKQLKRVREDMAQPYDWPQEQKGMQGGDTLLDVKQAQTWWHAAGNQAADTAEALMELGLHKSVTNRLLEPFMWHTMVVTSTEWQNFFDQRVSPLAQPEIRVTAEAMKAAYEASTPALLRDRQWHLPYIEREDEEAAMLKVGLSTNTVRDATSMLTMVSAARCARVSYLTQDGKRDLSEDVALYDRLREADPPHWSPLEHVATPWDMNVQGNANLFFYDDQSGRHEYKGARPAVGNLVGWRSLRTQFEAVKSNR